MSTRARGAMNEYFLPGDGIDRDVLRGDIERYLGMDCLLRPGTYEDPQTGRVQQGYYIRANRNLTSAMVADIKADSERWNMFQLDNPVKSSGGEHAASTTPKSTAYYSHTVPPYLSAANNPPSSAFYSIDPEATNSYSQPAYGFSHTTFDNYYTRETSDTVNTFYAGPVDSYYERPSSPTYSNSSASSEPWKNLPVVEHLTPPKKDLPIYLNGRYFRACADFGSDANVMDAKVARKLGLRISLDSSCVAFRLPIVGKTIKPIGRVMIECMFPGEPNTRANHPFFVFKNFVWPVIMGSYFLRKTQTFDVFPHRLSERPLEVQDVPIIAFLNGKKESLRFWLNGEELPSMPDTGSEINVMSYDFAITRFNIQEDDIKQVRFADGSKQRVKGKVSVPVSFGNGAPPSLLLKLVNLQSRSAAPAESPACGPDGAVNYGTTASILADFHILKGLREDIILGEDLLATVNAFVRHSADFNQLRKDSLYPGLATITIVKKVGKSVLRAFGKNDSRVADKDEERDDADSRFLDDCRKEEGRIKDLEGAEKRRAERKLKRRREEYERNRN